MLDLGCGSSPLYRIGPNCLFAETSISIFQPAFHARDGVAKAEHCAADFPSRTECLSACRL